MHEGRQQNALQSLLFARIHLTFQPCFNSHELCCLTIRFYHPSHIFLFGFFCFQGKFEQFVDNVDGALCKWLSRGQLQLMPISLIHPLIFSTSLQISNAFTNQDFLFCA